MHAVAYLCKVKESGWCAPRHGMCLWIAHLGRYPIRFLWPATGSFSHGHSDVKAIVPLQV